MTAAPTQTSSSDETGLVRTVLSIEVLGTTAFTGDLEDLAAACIDGDFSGAVLDTTTENVPATRMAQLLLNQGSDPEFLGLVALGDDEYVLLPDREADAVVCPHGERVWRGHECDDCFGD